MHYPKLLITLLLSFFILIPSAHADKRIDQLIDVFEKKSVTSERHLDLMDGGKIYVFIHGTICLIDTGGEIACLAQNMGLPDKANLDRMLGGNYSNITQTTTGISIIRFDSTGNNIGTLHADRAGIIRAAQMPPTGFVPGHLWAGGTPKPVATSLRTHTAEQNSLSLEGYRTYLYGDGNSTVFVFLNNLYYATPRQHSGVMVKFNHTSSGPVFDFAITATWAMDGWVGNELDAILKRTVIYSLFHNSTP
ncbi:hypothetical protein OAO01_01305 [Oligoflexia bacterium]|nr:hypothetical protein [Oligoflexia bacterium]